MTSDDDVICVDRTPFDDVPKGQRRKLDLLAVERYRIKARLRGKLYDVELVVKVKKGGKEGDREMDSVGIHRNYYHHDLHKK